MSQDEKANDSSPPKTTDRAKTIGFVFVDQFADWEFGLLSSSAAEWFGARTVAISPNGEPVRSMSGFQLNPQRSAGLAENADLDAIAVIGSDLWASREAPDITALLTSVRQRGGVVGGICAGTLALARAGLFAEARHTSNERQWLDHYLPDYPGRSKYEELPHAVADGDIVSAPGSAPGTFAAAFLAALYPEKAGQTAEMRRMFAREYAEAS